VGIDGTLDYIRGMCLFAVDRYGEPLKEDILHEMVLVFFALDAVEDCSVGILISGRTCKALHSLCNHVSRSNACIVQLGIPWLVLRLLLEPAADDEQTINYTVLVLLAAGVFCSLNHLLCDDGRVRFRDDGFFELT